MDIFDAVRINNINRVRELIASGVDINLWNNRNVTALGIATEFNKIDIFNELLQNPNIDVNKRSLGESALTNAILVENPIMVQSLLRHRNIDVNLDNALGRGRNSRNREIRELFNLYYPQMPETMDIFEAIRANNINRVRELIASGVDINLVNSSGLTPLMVAVISENVTIFNEILENPNIDINHVSFIRRSDPAYFFIPYENLEVVVSPFSALSFAIHHENIIAVVSLLMRRNIDVNICFALRLARDSPNIEIRELFDRFSSRIQSTSTVPVAPVTNISRVPTQIPEDMPETTDPLALLAKRLECSVCMTKAVNTRLNPCGHLLCSNCYAELPIKKCPICRVTVTNEPIFYGGYYNKFQKYYNKFIQNGK